MRRAMNMAWHATLADSADARMVLFRPTGPAHSVCHITETSPYKSDPRFPPYNSKIGGNLGSKSK